MACPPAAIARFGYGSESTLAMTRRELFTLQMRTHSKVQCVDFPGQFLHQALAEFLGRRPPWLVEATPAEFANTFQESIPTVSGMCGTDLV